MIKNLRLSSIQSTPFVATKEWSISNTLNDSLILLSQTGSNGEDLAIAWNRIIYGDGVSPATSSVGSIALSQQGSDDIIYQEGISGSGLFDLDKAEININGTYKRLVYTTINNMFYNDYNDPTKLWGLENISLQKDLVKKFVGDKIRSFMIPQNKFGDKVLEETVRLTDNSLDNEYEIIDDGLSNLYAHSNLFSRVQKLSVPGHFLTGSYWGYCDPYVNPVPTTTTTTTTPTTTTTTTTTTPTTTTTTTPTTTTTTTPTTTTTTPTTTTTTPTTTTTTTPTTTTTTTTTTPTTTTTTTPTTTTTTTTPTTTTTTTPTTTTTTTPTTTTTTTTVVPPFGCEDCSGLSTTLKDWDHCTCQYNVPLEIYECNVTATGQCSDFSLCSTLIGYSISGGGSFPHEQWEFCNGDAIVDYLVNICEWGFTVTVTQAENCASDDCCTVVSVVRTA